MFFTKVTGNRVSNHYARDIYINVSLKQLFSGSLLKQLIFLEILTICAVQVFSPELISPVVSFSRIFSIHQEHIYSGTPESVCYSFFSLECVKQEFILFISLFLQKIRRPVLVSYKLVTFNNKFTIIEFAPFSLVTKGSFVTFGKICLSVKGHSFIFSLIPCCSFSSKN